MWCSVSHVSVGVAVALLPFASACAASGYTPSALTGIVVYVDDGDTIDVRIGERVERVRYIGVDAPEISHEASHGRPARPGAPGGAAAARVNTALVAGRSVKLEVDVEPRDRYGRLLAYVWAGQTMINAELVARGYARAFPIPPNLRHATLFATLEAHARGAQRGLWGLSSAELWSEAVAKEGRGPLGRGAKPPPSERVRCARHGALVSYDLGAARSPASPTERRLWRSTRTSRSTTSIGCSKVSPSFRGSRRWCACPSISTVPISGAASRPRR